MTEPSEGAAEGLEAMDRATLRREFWRLVAVVNAGVLGASLGVLLLVFTARTTAGLALTVGGIVLLGYAARRYRSLTA